MTEPTALTRVEGQEFTDKQILLDGIEHVSCSFVRCRLMYSGKAGLALLECQYIECRWQFSGTAAVTVALMQAISSMGDDGRAVIAATFPALFPPAEESRIVRLDS